MAVETAAICKSPSLSGTVDAPDPRLLYIAPYSSETNREDISRAKFKGKSRVTCRQALRKRVPKLRILFFSLYISPEDLRSEPDMPEDCLVFTVGSFI